MVNLAINAWIGKLVLAMITAAARNKKGKFCITVSSVSKTVGILT